MKKMKTEESLERAQIAYKMGDFDLAKRLIERVIASQPDNPVGFNILGSIYEREKNYDLAINYFKRAIEGKGDVVSSYNNLAVAYKNKGDVEKSLDVFRQVLKMNPDRADIFYNLGNLYKDINLNQNAIEYYSKAIDLEPTYIVAYNNLGTVLEKMGKFNEALKVYNRGLQFDLNNPLLHYNVGIIYKRENRLQDAQEEFLLALKSQPGFTAAKNNLALILQQRGEYHRALNHFKEILKAEPGNPEIYNNIAVILGEQRIIDDAILNYRKALEINPQYYKARINLAFLYEQEGLYKEAVKELRELIAEEPTHYEARLHLGEILLNMNAVEEAHIQFRTILKNDPKNFQALRAEGRAFLKQGDLKSALKIKDALQKINSENRDFNLDLAYTYRDLHQYRKAEEEIIFYLQKNPNKIEAKILYADIEIAQGKKEDAERILLDIITSGITDAEIQYMLARVYKDMGRQEEAIEILNDLINVHGTANEVKGAKRLNEIMKLYEETIQEYESKMKNNWEKNLQKFKELGLDQGKGNETADDSFILEEDFLVEDTVPIINIGGLEPVFEIREEEEEVQLEEEEEEIPEIRERIIPVQEQEPQTLINLLEGQELYRESPHFDRNRSGPMPPPPPLQNYKENQEPQKENISPPPPPDYSQNTDAGNKHIQPPPPLDTNAINEMQQGLSEYLKTINETIKDSLSAGSLAAELQKQQPPPHQQHVPQQPPIIMTPPPVYMPPQQQAYEPPPVYHSEDALMENEGIPRFMEDDEDENLFPLNMPEEEPDTLPEEAVMEDLEIEPETVPDNSENDEIQLTEEPEDFLDEDFQDKEALLFYEEPEIIQEAEKADFIGNGELLRDELRSYISNVRNNLDKKENEKSRGKKSVKLLDYLSNMSNYLPQESRFSLLGNEMRLRVETLRSRLSGKSGLLEKIKRDFQTSGEPQYGDNVLTQQKLVGAFSFIRDLSQYVPDNKFSKLMQSKIESILFKIRSYAHG